MIPQLAVAKTAEPMTTADRIRAARRYGDYCRARDEDAPQDDITEITQSILNQLSRQGIEASSAQIAQAYSYDRAGGRSRGRQPSTGKVGMTIRIKALETAIKSALRLSRGGDEWARVLRAALRDKP